jgi:hypothetical protein
LGHVGADRIILKLTFKKLDVRVWNKFILLKMESNDGYFEHGNETLGPIKGDEILKWMRNRQLSEKNYSPWS